MKKRIETLLTVHETCTKIETFKRECDFYVKKAELTVGNEYNDLFIDSHTGPFFQKTNALTHERLMLIYGAKKGKSMNIQLSQYLNEII